MEDEYTQHEFPLLCYRNISILVELFSRRAKQDKPATRLDFESTASSCAMPLTLGRKPTMQRVRISEIAASGIDNINKMCIMPGSEPEAVLSILMESQEAHRQAAAMGAKVFGAFLEGGEPLTGAEKDVGFCAKIPTHYRINK
jgi:hypothetical protein